MTVLCLLVASVWSVPPAVADALLPPSVRPMLICKGMTTEQVHWLLRERPEDICPAYFCSLGSFGYSNDSPDSYREKYRKASVDVYYNAAGCVYRVVRWRSIPADQVEPIIVPDLAPQPAFGVDPPPPSKAGGKEVAPGGCTCTCTPCYEVK